MADVERGGAGLLRVTLDSPDGIGVEDCERVSHQLSRLLEVEAVSYERLEISSPGVDRALKRQRDFDQFIGEEVSVKLRRALDNRKQYSGVLGKGEGDAYTLMIPAEKKNGEDRELVFTLSELDSARLVPQLNFRRASK
jgi:ribosome maturation factor RimP